MQDAAFQRSQRSRKGEVVQVAQDNNPGIRIQGQNAVDETVDDLRLLIPLDLGTEHRRLETAKEWIISALGVEVIAYNKQLLAVEGKLACQRLATVIEGSISRIDAAWAEG
jgi:hypothetical protein